MKFIKNNIKIIILFLFLYLLYFKYYKKSNIFKEGFTWNQETIKDFIFIENSLNRQRIFDVNILQNVVSQEEVEYFNKNNIWPWSETTKEIYIKAVNKNPYIRNIPEDSLNSTMKIYNEANILKLLSYQTKEGQFLLNGILINDPSNTIERLPNGFGDFGYNSGLIENRKDDIIKCNMNKNSLERKTYTGKGNIYGEQTYKISDINYNDLETIIPNFTFVNNPCNPCVALNENADYSCPFKLNIKNDSSIMSDVWRYLWNISI